jgi:clan AA aspartic protease
VVITVKLRSLSSPNRAYEAEFLIDTGATDSLVPASELNRIGVQPIGRPAYELAKGTVEQNPFGLVEIAFMDEITAGRVIFGPDNAGPILGMTALESVGVTLDPASRTLKRLPAIPLKSTLRGSYAPRLPHAVSVRASHRQ